MTRPNVLILGHCYTTQFVDIYNQYTRLFDKDKFEVTVAYLTGVPNAEIKRRTIAEHVIFLNTPKIELRHLKIKAIKKLLALTREKKFQIVISHRYKPTYLMMWVAQFHKIPALFSVMHELKTMSNKSRQLLMAALSRKNMLLAGVSNAVRDDMRNDLWSLPKERIVTLYNTIDFELMEPQLLTKAEARRALNLSDDDFVFGNVGRLVPNKDQATLIHTFSMIKPHCPKAKLMIIGEGVLESQLRQQVRTYGLENDIIFTGFIPSGFSYMTAFDNFVLSSSQEAFGRVLLEAMIAKVPIIATEVDGIPEVVSDIATIVKPKNAAQLADAMTQVYRLSHAERQERGEKGYQHALANFSIPMFKEQFWQLPMAKKLLGNLTEQNRWGKEQLCE